MTKGSLNEPFLSYKNFLAGKRITVMPCFYPPIFFGGTGQGKIVENDKFFFRTNTNGNSKRKSADNRLIGGLIYNLMFFYTNSKEQFRIFKSKNIQKSLIVIDKIPELSVVCEKRNRKNL